MVYLTTHATRGAAKAQYIKGQRSFFRWAFRAGHIPEDPTRHLGSKAGTPEGPLGGVFSLVGRHPAPH